MNWLWMSLYHALAMLWATFWALVLGFSISAALQVFVSKEQMSRAFGRTTFKSVAVATGLGAASSSCSYAAAATGRSAIQQGAAVVPALAFMFASTNLVIELGVVLWILMGWRFVLAEFLGALVLVALVWLLVRLFLPKSVEEEMHRNAERKSADHSSCHDHGDHEHGDGRAPNKWSALANAFVMDWTMMWKELLGGFLIAGFIATLVPHSWWQALFLQRGPETWRLIENALVGPIIAIASFVCSVGNIPLASHLWSNGISFGGVISFIYADLLVIPLIIVYAKYYGTRAAIWITGIFYVTMVVAGVVVDLIFNLLGLIPTGPRPLSAVEHAMITWNYTSWLDIAAALVFLLMLFLHMRGGREAAHAHH
ncbi:MAG: permease [Chthoniobacterales bacterium]